MTSIYRARYRRTISTDSAPWHARPWVADVQNDARCGHFGRPRCTLSACPRHQPTAYAEYMARHATDSISPVDRDPWRGDL